MPIAITIDQTPQLIVNDVVTQLKAVTISGVPVFDQVYVMETEDWFQQSTNSFGQNICGVVSSRPDRRRGTDNTMDAMYLLTLYVVVQVKATVLPTGDLSTDVQRLNNNIDAVRTVLAIDKTRAGNCNNIIWDGKVIEGTDVNGHPKPLKAKANSTVLSATIPILCGWSRDIT